MTRTDFRFEPCGCLVECRLEELPNGRMAFICQETLCVACSAGPLNLQAMALARAPRRVRNQDSITRVADAAVYVLVVGGLIGLALYLAGSGGLR